MKIQFLILILILVLAIPAVADQLIMPIEPRLEIYTDKDSYYAGERGIITTEIETLKIAVENAKIGNKEKIFAIKRLKDFIPKEFQ